MTITLPPVENLVYNDIESGNSIRQFIHPETTISLKVIGKGKGFLLIEDGDKKYLFTKDKNISSVGHEYALLTNVIPTEERFKNGTIVIRQWLKHPLLKSNSPTNIIDSWDGNFFYKEENLSKGIPGLRQPQIAAIHMIMGHLKLPLETATVVMPTGTGKTETMLSALIANKCEKLLVTVPSDSLRDQIAGKFISLGLLKEFKVIGEDALHPLVGIIKGRFKSSSELSTFFGACNVVVTTMSWLTHQLPDQQEGIANLCSHVFIDEAHHIKAATWTEFKNRFAKEKVIQFTATPFRNDGKRLDGKIISNFPLRKAQEQGYYKRIEFIPVREYDNIKGDERVAEIAIARLRADLAKGYNHILMARCSTKPRAKEIFKLYEKHSDLNPVVIHSSSPDLRKVYQEIITRKSRVIVCVDMLGEGFDLPELKVAAFHDIRQSLPITLQLAGRFTRTKYDEQLGDASFVANIANLEVRSELADLYATDADWNEILSDASHEKIVEEVEFKDFMEGFKKLSDSTIPFQNITAKLSTVVYKNKTTEWFPGNFAKGISGFDDFDFKFNDINRDEHVLIIVTGKKLDVEWVHHKEIYNIQWDIIVVLWETKNNLLFIHSSDNNSLYKELAEAIIGDKAELIRGIDVFKTFHNVKRVRLQNVGLRQFLGKNIRFRMMVGSDVAEALSLAEKQRGEKAFVMGTGFENGNQVNIGASYKGRIWTKLKGNLKEYKKWCTALGKKLVDESIDSNQILKETLIPEFVHQIPSSLPIWIDWDAEMYLDTEAKYKFTIDGFQHDLSNIELHIVNPQIGGPLLFDLKSDEKVVEFEMQLFQKKSEDGSEAYPDFKVVQKSTSIVTVTYGSKSMTAIQFFESFVPTIWFADGSALTGNEYVQLKQTIGMFPKSSIISWDWTGVDISNESQHVSPKVTDSIQFHTIQQLLKEDWDFIYDDDYSGEIADIVAIKVQTDKVQVRLFHLKYAIDGTVSNQIKNFYEVCGQAQKSIHWKHKDGKDFINHLLRREIKSRNGMTCSRLEKGTKSELIKLLSIIKNEIPVEYEIYIVQPALSKSKASEDILMLLGVTETYIKEFAAITLNVIGSQ